MLPSADVIAAVLEELAWETVVEPTDNFQYRVQRRVGGYRDGVLGKMQAFLSIVLEVKQHTSEGGV